MLTNKSILLGVSLLLAGGLCGVSAQKKNDSSKSKKEFGTFSVKMKDGNKLTIKPSARFYMDGAAFSSDRTDLGNNIALTDLRLGMHATYRHLETKIDVGFAKGKVAAKDVFVQYNFNNHMYVRAGHYAEPMGIDHMESSANVKFMTANASSFAFAPGRKVGIEYIGWSKCIWGGVGMFGDSKSYVDGAEGDGGFSGTGRVVFNPLQQPGKIFHIGVAGTIRKADAPGWDKDHRELPRQIGFASPLLTNIKEQGDPLDANVTNASYMMKSAVELIAACGPVYFQGEYFHTQVNRTAGYHSYKADGAYGQVGVLAMGGKYTYSTYWARMGRPAPKSLEFVARFNYTGLNDAKAEVYGGNMKDLSIAANYYLNKWMMFRLNYSYMRMGDTGPFLAGENVNMVQARIQVVF